MEITINILGLDNLSDAINHLADSLAGQGTVDINTMKTAVKDALEINEEIPGEITEDLPIEDIKTFSLEEVRAKLTELTRAGKQKEIKDLITSFGAKNVTSIDPKDYVALMEKAGTL